jgi:hypothetical protein
LLHTNGKIKQKCTIILVTSDNEQGNTVLKVFLFPQTVPEHIVRLSQQAIRIEGIAIN